MWARRCAIALAAAGLLTGFPITAQAQYFGRNKVQYKKLDFQILKTEHFDIFYYPEEREGIDVAARMAERWRTRLGRIFGHELRGRQPLVLYASHPDFEQTNAIYGELSEGTGGVTEPLRRRIVLPMGGPLADTDHVIGHELVHAFQFDITTNPNSRPGENGAERLPLWFIEGMAEYLSLGPVDPNTAMWLRDAVRQKDEKTGKDSLPTIEELDNPKYFPYRWGQAFWAYVGGKYGDDVVRRMLAFASAAGDVNVAIERVLGIKTKELSIEWQDAIRRTYEPVLAATTPPNEIGRLVIRGTTLGADLNVGPAISPDGKWIAFLSTRSVFSTDLFVADAGSGKIVHRLTSTATDPHFSSIQFIYSAGGWDAASQRIAIATVVSGRPALAVFAAKSGDKEREIPLRELDEVFNPTWAPDGHAICFTGMTRGLTDLYVYDLAASKLQRLTNDAYADLMPAWSPDGKRIAFATDRFSSNLETLAIGDYRLAVIDPDSGAIQALRAFTTGKNINPQWTPDGSGLLFISDRDGIPNLYRIAVDSGDVAQVTRIGTGISGITSSSPALSVASRTGEAAFSVYQGGKYDIYTLDLGAGPQRTARSEGVRGADEPARAVGTSGALADRAPDAGTLPPLERRTSEVQALLQNATLGLPPATEYPSENYKPALSLEGLAQPTVAVGANRFGAAVGGGIALQFGDMLGDHQLLTAVQLNSGVANNFSLKNTAAQVMYFNQAHRWNWGIVGGQIPYLSGGFQSGFGTIGGEPAQIEQTILFRQTEQSVTGILAYPFSRAHRVELQGGVTRISFDQIVETTAFSLNTGNLLLNDSTTSSIGDTLSLANTSAALVYDTSNFGATSPVQGQRYRLEAAPTFGSLNYTTLMADYRRYFMPVSFYTVAARLLHYGRYGSGSDDTRLYPLFIGYPNLVRGYDVGTFNTQDCTPNAVSDCPEFDRLQGSRLLVANLEFRFPLLRPFGATQRMYGPVPVEVAFFADAGWAWNTLQQVAIATSLLGVSQVPHAFNWRDGVTSAGVALRVNLFGYAVGQFDFAHPFQRPGSGWVFQFNLSPGF
jgi:Tol biopolymer transport system component